jgi:hypothetical protein
LRELLLPTSTPVDVRIVTSAVESAVATLEEYNATYGPWLDQCIISFYRLSEKSELSSAFLLLFWNLSVLCMVEQLHLAASILSVENAESTIKKAQGFQRSAVRSSSATAQRIVNVSSTGEFKLMNSVQSRLQFVSHHANTSLVVMALVKAIEHTIDLNLSSDTTEEFPSTDWIASIKPLLTCLLTLESTVSGACTARPALQELMQRYADILMDCWSHEDADTFL